MVLDFGAVYGTGLWSCIQCKTLEPYTVHHFGAVYGVEPWSHIWHRTLEPYTTQDFGAVCSTGPHHGFAVMITWAPTWTIFPLLPLYNIWWLIRVTLVVDWLFLPQNFGSETGNEGARQGARE